MGTPRHIDWESVQSAFAIALAEHGDQARKGSDIPYMSHLWGVASLVLEHGGQTDDVCAALLHDTAEDQGGEETLARVKAQFGEHVADMVRGLSDALPAKGEDKPPWRARKEAYVRGVVDEPIDVLRVSAADKLHNLRAMTTDLRAVGPELWDRFNEKNLKSHLWYLEALTSAYEARAAETMAWPGSRGNCERASQNSRAWWGEPGLYS